MKKQNINTEKPKRSFWWIVGYIATWLIFFAWVGIFICWLDESFLLMYLWLWITLVCFVVMLVLHIVIFRLKWETQKKWIRILKRIWKCFWWFLLIALVLLIINMIYGKIQYSKIPEVDESIFQRNEHQTQLPEDEDALIQLRKFDDKYSENELWENLEAIYKASITNAANSLIYKDSKVWWYRNTDECIMVYSGDEASCGTWVWDKETLSRILDRKFNTNQWWTIWREDYLSLSGDAVTIREYLDAKEPEIIADLQELDRIVSMDYYLPNDQFFALLPDLFQRYTRGSMIMLLYYTDKWDWDMVDYIIKLNYKSADILNHFWGLISFLMSVTSQDYVDSTVNSVMQLFPEDLRLNLAKFYEENMPNREDIVHQIAKWEYVLWNEQIKWFKESYGEDPAMNVLINYPMYSEKDTKRLMLYGYSILYNDNPKEFDNLTDNIIKKMWYSVYNIWWSILYWSLMPRLQWYNYRLDWNIWHKEALIENLKSGEYKVWFNEKQWNDNHDYYEINRIPTDEKLAE